MRGKESLNELRPKGQMTAEIMGRIGREYPRLRSLSLASNSISYVYSIAIKKIENLHRLPLLEKLNLSKNQIYKIEGLGFQSNLRELNLAHNFIEVIQGLESLINLTMLNLSYNKISDINEIKKLQVNTSLRILSLEGNPITNTK